MTPTGIDLCRRLPKSPVRFRWSNARTVVGSAVPEPDDMIVQVELSGDVSIVITWNRQGLQDRLTDHCADREKKLAADESVVDLNRFELLDDGQE